MTDILNIEGESVFDDRIVKIETHTYNPYANTMFEHSDEIRIPIQQQDLYTLPYESFLYIEGKLAINEPAEGSNVVLGNNRVAFMFDEIRYELDGVEIDRNRNVGITSTLKNYVTVSSNRTVIMRNAGWDAQTNDEIRYELDGVEIDRNRNVGITSTLKNYVTISSDKTVIMRNAGWNAQYALTDNNNANGYFNFCVPLYMLLGFCEDYRRVVINARHELILIRSRNDNNCLLGNLALEPVIDIFKIQWRMPHVVLNEINKLSILRALESGRYLSMGFRSWDLYEFPLLQRTTKHSWPIKTATHCQLEKPRYVVFALQIGRKNVMSLI
ncbi:uncharacterized protein LOC115237292 [Formica exsecta]|uniref:uncharacterized protein LOC115237292 n=1 Tax=Formica exsecta TaxID=72781 RepID=UPI00114119FD|nr:uncharacterized protein LOC115237292 [Formica exsecta]